MSDPNSHVKYIWLVRHAESLGNTGQESDLDPPLTPRGQQQAKRLAEALEGVRFERIYLSPLKRTRDTFERSGVRTGDIQYDTRILEWRAEGAYGELLPYMGLPDYAHPDPHEAWMTPFSERIQSFADEIRMLDVDHILVVTHGGAAVGLANALVGRAPYASPRHLGLHPMNNTGIGQFRLSRDGEKCLLSLWNHTGHLGRLGLLPQTLL